MERVVLVHGSVVNGRATWSAQRPLAERFELVVLDRPGLPPNPPAERVDFEPDATLVAELLRAGDHLVGHSYPAPPDLAQGAQTLSVERGPWEAEIPLDALAAATFPNLVVSGGHHPAFDAICDVLEHELPAARAVLRGYGHVVQLHPQFNALLADFV